MPSRTEGMRIPIKLLDRIGDATFDCQEFQGLTLMPASATHIQAAPRGTLPPKFKKLR